MKTRIFAYKDWIGVESSEKCDGIIAKPGGGNIGVVVNTEFCEITPEAKRVFQGAHREGGSFAPFALTTHSDPHNPAHGKSSFGWIGGYLNASHFLEVAIGRDCDLSALDDITVVETLEIPEEFKEFVNQQNIPEHN